MDVCQSFRGWHTYARSLEELLMSFRLLPCLLLENGDPSNDRGGLSGDRLTTGFDPSAKGFYHGGDLKGLMSRLDYIQSLGATALWVAPIFRNSRNDGPPPPINRGT